MDGNLEFELKIGNGKIKEYHYFNGLLKYEGEYKNGEKNGKGKEYDEYGLLKFEGEYLNEEKNGKIKQHHLNRQLKFDGEYLNGKRWNGNAYDTDGDIIYELINGIGEGKEYNKRGELKFMIKYENGIGTIRE